MTPKQLIGKVVFYYGQWGWRFGRVRSIGGGTVRIGTRNPEFGARSKAGWSGPMDRCSLRSLVQKGRLCKGKRRVPISAD